MSISLRLSTLIGHRPVLAIICIWAVVCFAMALTSPHLPVGRFPDVDDALRLVQVRDLMAGQGWFDLYQHRMNPPEGTLMHWSRLVDAPLAALIWLLALVLPPASAEYVACFVMPLLVLLATMLAVGRVASERFGAPVALLAAIAFVVVPMVPAQFQPMRIDHHSWQILSVAVAMWAVFRPDAVRGGLIAGLAMAAGLMISLETIVMAAGFALLLMVRWLRNPAEKVWLLRYLQSLGGALVALFLLTRGLQDLAPHCDVIAPAHLGFFAVVAVGVTVLGTLRHLSPIGVLAGLALSGVLGLVVVGTTAPACLGSPFAALDPLVHKHWFLNVAEGQPLWRGGILALPAALPCLSALGIAAFAALRGEAANRRWWHEYALLLAIAIAAGLATYRSIAFAGMLATLPLGWFAAAMIARWQVTSRLASKVGIAVAFYAAVLPAPIISALLPWLSTPTPVGKEASGLSNCQIQRTGAQLNALAPAKLFSHLDIAPLVLTYTHHSVVASGHHRSNRAMRTVIAAFTSAPTKAHDMILATGSDYLIACLDQPEMSIYVQSGGRESLAALLVRDDAPTWLKPVSISSSGNLRLWQIVRPQQSGAASAVHDKALPKN